MPREKKTIPAEDLEVTVEDEPEGQSKEIIERLDDIIKIVNKYSGTVTKLLKSLNDNVEKLVQKQSQIDNKPSENTDLRETVKAINELVTSTPEDPL